jgi:hypothetical protein
VDGASALRQATRHDGECQRTQSTRLRTRVQAALDNGPPRHTFDSGSLASGDEGRHRRAAVMGRHGAPQPMRWLKVAGAHASILAMKGW